MTPFRGRVVRGTVERIRPWSAKCAYYVCKTNILSARKPASASARQRQACPNTVWGGEKASRQRAGERKGRREMPVMLTTALDGAPQIAHRHDATLVSEKRSRRCSRTFTVKVFPLNGLLLSSGAPPWQTPCTTVIVAPPPPASRLSTVFHFSFCR